MDTNRFLRTDDPDLTRTVTVGLQKGGTSKSTFTAEVGHEAARLGARVLLIDFDPNWGLTSDQLGYDPVPLSDENGDEPDPDLTVADLLNDCQDGGAGEAILNVPEKWAMRSDLDWEHGGVLTADGALGFIPGYPTLQPAVEGAINVPAAERRLRRSLRGVARHFDLVLIDTGPRADKVAQTALLAAATCVAPVLPEFGSVKGLRDQLEFLDAFATAWEHPIRFGGAICTRFDKGAKKAHGDGLEDLRASMEHYEPHAPEVSGRLTLSGTEPHEFNGSAGATIWDEVLPKSTALVNMLREHAPLTTPLVTLGETPTFHQRKQAERVLGLTKGYTRVALRLLQLTEAPCLPKIAQALLDNPIPGVWPLDAPAAATGADDLQGTEE